MNYSNVTPTIFKENLERMTDDALWYIMGKYINSKNLDDGYDLYELLAIKELQLRDCRQTEEIPQA